MPSTRLPVAAATVVATLTPSIFAAGGDDASTATPITEIPFMDAGNTTGFTDQFDVACPFSGSTSPDAWYSFVAGDDESIQITLCDSAYDTKVYVLDADFNDVVCNDDACDGTFRSRLITPDLVAGTYFVVVDGWSGSAGAYELTIETPEWCRLECPAEAIQEGEPCDDTGETSTNGGCNQVVFAIDDVTCGDIVCGEAWAIGGVRDTDWYRLAPPGFGGEDWVTGTLTSGFDGTLIRLIENPDCGSISVVFPDDSFACGRSATVARAIDSFSETWWVVATIGFDLYPCGLVGGLANRYVLSLSCEDDVPPPPCPTLGDANADGFVDFVDLLTVLANFGTCP